MIIDIPPPEEESVTIRLRKKDSEILRLLASGIIYRIDTPLYLEGSVWRITLETKTTRPKVLEEFMKRLYKALETLCKE